MYKLKTALTLVFVSLFLMSPVYAQDNGYSLVPSEENIKTHVNTSNTGYGINVKLLLNSSLVQDQSNVKFDWIVADKSIISLSSWTATSCTFDITAACPNNTADIKGLKVGKTSIYIVAYVDGVKSAATTVNVEVVDVWNMKLKKGEKTIKVGESMEYEIGINKIDSPKYKPGSEINFIWQEVTKPNAPTIISFSRQGCSSEGKCPNSKIKLSGVQPGRTTIQVIALSDNVRLAMYEFDIEVKGDPVEEYRDIPIEELEVQENINPIYYEDPMNNSFDVLKSELDSQKKMIEEQQVRLNEQAVKIQNTETLLQRILTILRGLFK